METVNYKKILIGTAISVVGLLFIGIGIYLTGTVLEGTVVGTAAAGAAGKALVG